MIRIDGYMNYEERLNTKRLEVFIHNVLPFFKDSDKNAERYLSTKSREVYCSGTISTSCMY